MGYVKFMATGLGRLIRMVLGLALILWGLLGLHGAAEQVVGTVGLVAFAAGLFNFCLVAPLFGAPIRGSALK